jgi:hypothetical protein
MISAQFLKGEQRTIREKLMKDDPELVATYERINKELLNAAKAYAFSPFASINVPKRYRPAICFELEDAGYKVSLSSEHEEWITLMVNWGPEC